MFKKSGENDTSHFFVGDSAFADLGPFDPHSENKVLVEDFGCVDLYIEVGVFEAEEIGTKPISFLLFYILYSL